MSNYYYPTVEELYVGFECEINASCVKPPIYVKKVLNVLDMEWALTKNPSIDQELRVKLLDTSDIISLGWNQTFDDRYIFVLKGYVLLKQPSNILYIYRNISNNDISTIFVGKVMNKSELKKLMIQLEIM